MAERITIQTMEEVKRYVAPWGNDAAAGTEQEPWQTFKGAADAVRALRKADSSAAVTVYFRGGVYAQTQTVLLTEEDSGSKQAPVTYCAYPGEEPRFVGGFVLHGSDAVPVPEGEMRDRIPTAARNRVRMIDATAFMDMLTPCFESEYNFAFSEEDSMFLMPRSLDSCLFVDGKRFEPARYPNRDQSIGSWRSGNYATATFMEHLGPNPRTADFRMYFDEQTAAHISTWSAKALDRLFIYGHLFSSWYDSAYRVDAVDAANACLTVKGGTGSYAWGNERTKRPFFFCNVPEELDVPGESYFDFDTKKIYFYPAADFAAESEIYICATRQPMLHLQGCRHIHFLNLDFGYGCETGISVCNSRHIRFEGGTYAHFSHCSFKVVRSTDVLLRSLHIFDNGCNGIELVECGDCKTLTPCRVTVENCEIHDVSSLKKCGTTTVGVQDCCGATIRGCSLYNSAMTLIAPSECNDLVIENNEIHHACLDADDCGAISWCRTPLVMGAIIRNNYFHDIGNRAADFGIHAIYVDDFSVGPEIYNNIFDNCAISKEGIDGREDGFCMIYHTYGSFINVHNNIFVCHENQKPMHNLNDYSFPLWISFVNDTDAIACWENYHWRNRLQERGFFSETWRRHYRGTQWERMWDYCNDAHYEAFHAILQQPDKSEIERQAEQRMYIYEELWDHLDAKGNFVNSTLAEYIQDAYRIVYRTYRNMPEDPKEVRPPLLHLTEDLLYDDKIHYASSWGYENNVTIGVKDAYLGPNRITWGHGARGTEHNLNLVKGETETGDCLFAENAPDFTLAPVGLAFIRRRLPNFTPIDTSIIGCKRDKS